MEVLKELVDISEMFNSTVDIDWVQKGDAITGTFSVDDQQYVIMLEFASYPFANKQRSLVNIAFYKKMDGKDEPVFDLTNDTKNPMKVLGAIVNGSFKILKKHPVDAVIFAAANNVEKRMEFYNKLAMRFAKNFGSLIKDVKADSGTFSILVSTQIPVDERREFAKFVAERNKAKA